MRQRLARFLLLALTTAACRGQAPLSDTKSNAPTGTSSGSAAIKLDGEDTDHAEGQYAMKSTPTEEKLPPAPPPSTVTVTKGNTTALANAKQAQQYGVLGAGSGSAMGASGTGMGYGVGGGRGGMRGHGASASVADPVSNTESYAHHDANAWTVAANDHLSTFAVDVDTASYTIARRKLTEGQLPPHDAVRVEEFVNYFHYAYGAPDKDKPFSVTMDAAPSPFSKDRTIVRVGVASKPLSVGERKNANLVFLVDVSGSMQSPDKLELAKRSLRILVDNLKDGDTVSLVTYAGDTRLVLPPTGLEHKGDIMNAIEELTAGGGTGMASGIETAYEQAEKGLEKGKISRVLVLTDGDANIGPTSHEQILELIEGKVKEGVTLSTIGFGMGNYKDDTMEQLADKGNGNAFYIDSLSAAKRVFQEQLGSTLEVVAQDVKLQVDFDPKLVSKYRLIGYENRDIADDDFRNDKVDAGEIGAGHQVTAVYEIELKKTITADLTPSTPIATMRVRWKEPRGTKAAEAAYAFDMSHVASTFAAAPDDLRFAFAVAAFADVLRGGEDASAWKLGDIRAMAAAAAGTDSDRAELVALIDRAIKLSSGGSIAAKTAIAQ